MKVLSFSLWGTAPKYIVGAIRNAELARQFYPEWRCRFYCGTSVELPWMERLASFHHVDLVRPPDAGDWRSLFWRFRAAADPGVDVAVFRDTDSRLNARERSAVDAWLASDRAVHVMRDHPQHNVPILGGMWGVRGGLLRDIAALIDIYPHGNYWQIDQQFLAEVIAPRTRDCWMEHDDYFAARPFPVRRRGREFVGQPFDEHDRPLIEGPTEAERRLRHAARRMVNAIRPLREAWRR